MLIRKHYIANAEGLGDAETKVWDINYLKPITAIDIHVRATNGSGTIVKVPIPLEVSNISIVDGAFNLTSSIMAALMANQVALGAGKPHINETTTLSEQNEYVLRIHFGFFFGDTEHYLDPTRFNNLQLRLTSAFTISATTYATGTGEVSIVAHVLEQGAEPYKGVVMTKEVARPTLAANAAQVIDLPVDYPYLGFTLVPYSATVIPSLVLNEFKVAQDADSLIWFDEEILDIMKHNFAESGYTPVDLEAIADWVVTGLIGLVPAVVLATAYCLFGSMWVNPCDHKRGKLVSVAGINSLKATLLGGATGGAVRIITNQLYTR